MLRNNSTQRRIFTRKWLMTHNCGAIFSLFYFSSDMQCNNYNAKFSITFYFKLFKSPGACRFTHFFLSPQLSEIEIIVQPKQSTVGDWMTGGEDKILFGIAQGEWLERRERGKSRPVFLSHRTFSCCCRTIWVYAACLPWLITHFNCLFFFSPLKVFHRFAISQRFPRNPIKEPKAAKCFYAFAFVATHSRLQCCWLFKDNLFHRC